MSGGLRKFLQRVLLATLIGIVSAGAEARAQRAGTSAADEAEFGPVVRTYLGYLRAEQEVVDDRASRHEVSLPYYRRNSNRIRALRQMALRIARETKNDFVPELYAVTRDELGTLFDPQPQPDTFRIGEVVDNTFRYLGTLRSVEPFYFFARLDVYEQAERLQQGETHPAAAATTTTTASAPDSPATTEAPRGNNRTRPRRVNNHERP